MPVVNDVMFGRMPLPSLRTYSLISVLMVSLSLWYSHQVVLDRRVNEALQNIIADAEKRTQLDINEVVNTANEKSSIDEEGLVGEYRFDASNFINKSDDDGGGVGGDRSSGVNDVQWDEQNELTGPTTEQIIKQFVAQWDVVNGETDSDGNDDNEIKDETDEDVAVEIDVGEVVVELEPRSHLAQMIDVMMDEAWCVWSIINMAYCCLILLAKLIQHVVFGQLRVSERQHLKDRFWNFVFHKFIFIFGVMNVQTMEEIFVWSTWFSILGFLHLLAQMSKDRFEYLSFSPTTPRWTHARVLSLLCFILLTCTGLMGVSVAIGFQLGLHIFAFMTAECILLTLKTLHVILRYAMHLYDLNHDGLWENRGMYNYYAELSMELSALCVDMCHHLHMLLWANIFLSMASLVICMQLRFLYNEIQRRIKKHRNYRRVVSNMEARFSPASAEELAANDDDCAICWDRMASARKLPCGHLFHNSCLRSWLEHDTSCPTCRTSLNVFPGGSLPDSDDEVERPTVRPPAPRPRVIVGNRQPVLLRGRRMNRRNHIFHFDGSRIASWMPSFSVQVTHTQMLGPQMRVVNSQLDNMVHQVHTMFPHVPINVIQNDIRITRSVELTVDNILEGRVEVPPIPTGDFTADGAPPPPSPSTTPSPPSSPSATPSPPSSPSATPSPPASPSATPSSPPPPPPSEEQPPEPNGTSNMSLFSEVNPPTTSMATSTRTDVEKIEEYSQCDSSGSVSEGATASDDVTSSSIGGVEAVSSRFSKSPVERESIFADRKKTLLYQARRRFIAKEERDVASKDAGEKKNHNHHPFKQEVDHTEPTNTSNEDVKPNLNEGSSSRDRKRALALEAAQRRLNSQNVTHPHDE